MSPHAREIFAFLLGIALHATGRVAFEWWMAWWEQRSGRTVRRRVRQKDYYTPCGDECTIK